MDGNSKLLTTVKRPRERYPIRRYEIGRSHAGLFEREAETLSGEIAHNHEDKIIRASLRNLRARRARRANAEIKETPGHAEPNQIRCDCCQKNDDDGLLHGALHDGN